MHRHIAVVVLGKAVRDAGSVVTVDRVSQTFDLGWQHGAPFLSVLDSAPQSPDRAEGKHGDQSGCGRLLVMAVWRRCTLRELEQSVAFATDHFLGEEGPPEAAT
jgi:hypothetical protein